MSISKKTKRNLRRKRVATKRLQRLDRGQPLPRRDFTVDEWCEKRRISRGLFYAMMRNGTAPRTMKIRKRRTITFEADVARQAQNEAATAQAT
jgi:predicted DNA-binding transcriptional regulator AlpA